MYEPGQPVTLTFTETNNGTQPIPVVTGPGILNTRDGTQAWRSPYSVEQPAWMMSSPDSPTRKPRRGTAHKFRVLYTVSNFFDPSSSTVSFEIPGVVPTGGFERTGASESRDFSDRERAANVRYRNVVHRRDAIHGPAHLQSGTRSAFRSSSGMSPPTRSP